jgi:hypothetical protein
MAGGECGMMPDREKVIKGCECCSATDHGRCEANSCPYWVSKCCCIDDVLNDAIALLKEQEAEPEIEGGGSTWWYVCSECRGAIDDSDRYCRHCGARMKGK